MLFTGLFVCLSLHCFIIHPVQNAKVGALPFFFCYSSAVGREDSFTDIKEFKRPSSRVICASILWHTRSSAFSKFCKLSSLGFETSAEASAA